MVLMLAAIQTRTKCTYNENCQEMQNKENLLSKLDAF